MYIVKFDKDSDSSKPFWFTRNYYRNCLEVESRRSIDFDCKIVDVDDLFGVRDIITSRDSIFFVLFVAYNKDIFYNWFDVNYADNSIYSVVLNSSGRQDIDFNTFCIDDERYKIELICNTIIVSNLSTNIAHYCGDYAIVNCDFITFCRIDIDISKEEGVNCVRLFLRCGKSISFIFLSLRYGDDGTLDVHGKVSNNEFKKFSKSSIQDVYGKIIFDSEGL